MTRTLTILAEGITAAVDVATAMTTQGSETAPGREVPAGMSKISRIIAAVASDGAVDGGSTFILRIGGTAVQGGPVNLIIGAAGGEQTASADQTANAMVFVKDVDIPVKAGNVITCSTEYGGVDQGSPAVGVTLYFT